MRVIESPRAMQRHADELRRSGRTIGLVPTMGSLHEGHLALVRRARGLSDVVVASIFVNPAQFGPAEDYGRYPRNLPRDLDLCEREGVGVVFAPAASDMYPEGFQTFVEVAELARPLCGKSRPAFFRGVATVVSKLFHIVKPHVAVFGEKDWQQLQVIRRMTRDLDLDVEVVGHETVREPDGLAMSSRNAYLSEAERGVALRIPAALDLAVGLVSEGERNAAAILFRVREALAAGGGLRLDYAELRDPETLEEVAELSDPALLAVACFVGATRLIDNRVLRP